MTNGLVIRMPSGRKRKENAVKRTYRMNRLILKMIGLYGADRSMDNTTALNHVAYEYLTSLGYKKRAEELLEAEDADAEKDTDSTEE